MNSVNKPCLIIISTYFHPINSVASNRIEAFAKYLPTDKFNIHIITLDDGSPSTHDFGNVQIYRYKNKPFIRKFTFKKKTSVFIRKSKSLFNKILANYILKEHRNWQQQALIKARNLVLENHNCIIISSYAPLEAHLIPLELKNENLPFLWIADFRDEMSLNPYNKKKWQLSIKKYETQILENVDAVTTVSLPFIKRFQQLSAKLNTRYEEVRNGFDFDYMPEKNPKHNKIFTICYFGTIYAAINLTHFYKAVNELHFKLKLKDFRINLIGVGDSFPIPASMHGIISKTGRIPHDEALINMQNSDALLFILPKISWTGVYSGKLFEYLGCRKPIIALTDPDDVAAKLINECNAGFIADFDNEHEIRTAFLDAYNLWKSGKTLNFNDIVIEQHQRKNQVARLENLIYSLQNNVTLNK